MCSERYVQRKALDLLIDFCTFGASNQNIMRFYRNEF